LCLAGGVQRAEVECALHLLEAQRWVQPVAVDAIRVEPYHGRIAEIVSQAISPALRTRDCAARGGVWPIGPAKCTRVGGTVELGPGGCPAAVGGSMPTAVLAAS